MLKFNKQLSNRLVLQTDAKCKKAKSSFQNMHDLRQAVFMAKKVGEELGSS
jgi:hypothetical protein